MDNLSERQVQILKAIIQEYMETAAPVGSEILDKKYNLGVSPATIRNEMVNLTKTGLLKQPHTSAGRSPTPQALKYYVHELMKEEDLSVADEMAVKGKIWDYREKMDRLFHEVTRVLSEKTKSLAVVSTEEGDIYHAGYANILDEPEFFDIDVARTALSVIDDFEKISRIFSNRSEAEVQVLLGEEIGIHFLEPCGIVFTSFATPKVKGSLGVIGSCRLAYPKVIPTLRYLSDLVEEIGKTW